MPYTARKHPSCPDSKPWAVVKKDTGAKIACHPTKQAAIKQIGAIASRERLSEGRELTFEEVKAVEQAHYPTGSC